jgi:hypothetical protein
MLRDLITSNDKPGLEVWNATTTILMIYSAATNSRCDALEMSQATVDHLSLRSSWRQRDPGLRPATCRTYCTGEEGRWEVSQYGVLFNSNASIQLTGSLRSIRGR